MHLHCAVSSKCDTLCIYVNSMPFMADMGTHADNCKRILFFTRSTVDQVRIHTRNLVVLLRHPLLCGQGELDRARGKFDDYERVQALTELERDVCENKEFVFACVGSQEMQASALAVSMLQYTVRVQCHINHCMHSLLSSGRRDRSASHVPAA